MSPRRAGLTYQGKYMDPVVRLLAERGPLSLRKIGRALDLPSYRLLKDPVSYMVADGLLKADDEAWPVLYSLAEGPPAA